MTISTKKIAKLDKSSFCLIDAMDAIDKCIRLVRGAESTYNDAIDSFPVPVDPNIMERINNYHVTSATIMDVVCATLRRTSVSLGEYVHNLCKEGES